METASILSLEMSAFRQFAHTKLLFDQRVSCIVGENGSGKTTILEANAAIVAALIQILTGTNPRPLGSDDRSTEPSGNRDQPSATVRGLLWVDDTGFVVEVSLTAVGRFRTRVEAALRHQLMEARTAQRTLPIFAFYRSGRLWWEPPVESHNLGRLRAYARCLDPVSQTGEIVEWLTLQQRDNRETAEIFVSTIAAVLRSQGESSIAIERGEVVLTTGRARRLPLRHYADGQRSIVLLAMDLAWRMCVLNAHLGSDAISKTPGIVLIDELDLHIHPRWQRAIVASLQSAFPRVQLITTTHSPFIVQELSTGQLLNLDGRSEDPAGALEDISERVMGVLAPSQSMRRQKLLEAATEFFTAVDSGASTASIERIFNEQIRSVTSDVAALAFMRSQIIAARKERK